MAIDGLPDEIRPDKIGRWAGDAGDRRYYHLWYSRSPWGNWKVNYSIDLRPQENLDQWFATVLFENRRKLSLPALDGLGLNATQESNQHGTFIFIRTGLDTLNESFANKNAETLRQFIEELTPIIDDLENETGEEDEP